VLELEPVLGLGLVLGLELVPVLGLVLELVPVEHNQRKLHSPSPQSLLQ